MVWSKTWDQKQQKAGQITSFDEHLKTAIWSCQFPINIEGEKSKRNMERVFKNIIYKNRFFWRWKWGCVYIYIYIYILHDQSVDSIYIWKHYTKWKWWNGKYWRTRDCR